MLQAVSDRSWATSVLGRCLLHQQKRLQDHLIGLVMRIKPSSLRQHLIFQN